MLPMLVRIDRRCARRIARWTASATLGAAIALALAAPVSAQTSQEKWREIERERSQFRLFAAANLVLQANLVQCGVDNVGNVCTNVFNSPTGGGGFWPSGTTNQYIFNSGLQIAGMVPLDAGFDWAGDTVGAYFFDARGTQPHGTPRTNIFDSLDPEDQANWPVEALIDDPDIFHPLLLGSRDANAAHSTWVRYWDGDPNRIAARAHPMGIEVEQRSLAFNAPPGIEHTIFFIYKFTNVTNDPEFVQLNRQRFPQAGIPDAGFRIDSIYVTFGMDPDVTVNATENFSTAILPFNMGIAYKGDFVADDFDFTARADLYQPPFFEGPGFVGVKYLRSPVDPLTDEEVGLTMFTNSLNQDDGFPDPEGVQQLWRYLSGNADPSKGDNPCNIADPKGRRLCFLFQSEADTRFYQASGPFSLDAGQSATIVVAYTHGAPVTTAAYTPGDVLPPGIPSPTPGTPGDTTRIVERLAGWVSTAAGAETDGAVTEDEVTVVPRSVLANGVVAQNTFNNQFLLPAPPTPAPFTLVPGDRQVTVIWDESAAEQAGDPYFVIASDPDPENLFFDPNYRPLDVEGYRIFRATGLSGEFELVAQFDKIGTVFTDVSGQLDPTFVPEEGPYGAPVDHPLVGDIIQFPTDPPARIRDQNTGNVVILAADTVTLEDTGVPFVFVDTGLQNGITYRYFVVAFDVNSLRSGTSLLESARQTQVVVPRPAGRVQTVAPGVTVSLRGESGTDLPLDAPLPTIDAEGRFSGPMPPTNGLVFDDLILALGEALLPGPQTVITIDSVRPWTYSVEYFVTVGGTEARVLGSSSQDVGLPTVRNTEEPTHSLLNLTFAVPADTTVISGLFETTPKLAGALPVRLEVGRPHFSSGNADWAPTQPAFWAVEPSPEAVDGGSRWFEGANETLEHPTLGDAHGELPGFTIFQPAPFVNVAEATLRRFYQGTFAATRSADIQFEWAAGQIQRVYDVTHDVEVPFHTGARASYGFIPDADGDGVISHLDTRQLDFDDQFGGWKVTPTVPMEPQPVVASVDVTGDGASDGTGFGLYIAGEPYFFLGTPPAAATWTLRTYHGVVDQTATGYTFTPSQRMPAVPGLTMVVDVTSPAEFAVNNDLSDVHTVPDPYYVRSAFDLGPANKALYFVNLPAQAIVRIYSVNGTLVRVLTHDDPTGGGQLAWDLRNRNNQFVASGVYFYVVEAPSGAKKVAKFTVIQFAQ